MISSAPTYEYEIEKKVFSEYIYSEPPVGLKPKQDLHIRVKEASQLNELIILLSNGEVYDLVRMDYYISNLKAVKKELMTKIRAASTRRQELYETTLGESFTTVEKKITDGFAQISLSRQYKSYEAYDSVSL